MRALVASLLSLGACSAPASQPSLSSSHPAPAPVARDTPSPSIAWQDTRFVTARLPAVARDASLAVVAVDDGDGGRGFPNLRIEVRDRSDVVTATRQLLESSDYEALAPDGAPGAELARRITDGNAQLSDLHARHDLVPTTPLELEDPRQTEALPIVATGDDGLEVRWEAPRVVVRRAGKQLASIDGSAWLPAPGKRCPTCEPCSNPAFLAGVSKAPGIDVAVVELGFNGTDLCWEPGHQFHVVAW